MTDQRGPLGQKPQKPERGTTAAREYLARVKSLPCAICGAPPPSDAHHCISGRYGSRKASDFDAIPLCKAHHQYGPEAIHQDKAAWEAQHGPDTGYIDSVRNTIARRFSALPCATKSRNVYPWAEEARTGERR